MSFTCYWECEPKGPRGEPRTHFGGNFPLPPLSPATFLLFHLPLSPFSSPDLLLKLNWAGLLACGLSLWNSQNIQITTQALVCLSADPLLASILSNVSLFTVVSSCFFAATILRLANSWNRLPSLSDPLFIGGNSPPPSPFLSQHHYRGFILIRWQTWKGDYRTFSDLCHFKALSYPSSG